jgi:hypothetical protein
MDALKPSISPGRASWRIKVFPPLELTDSFTFPEQSRKIPLAGSFSRNSVDPAGWELEDLIDSNSLAATGDK